MDSKIQTLVYLFFVPVVYALLVYTPHTVCSEKVAKMTQGMNSANKQIATNKTKINDFITTNKTFETYFRLIAMHSSVRFIGIPAAVPILLFTNVRAVQIQAAQENVSVTLSTPNQAPILTLVYTRDGPTYTLNDVKNTLSSTFINNASVSFELTPTQTILSLNEKALVFGNTYGSVFPGPLFLRSNMTAAVRVVFDTCTQPITQDFLCKGSFTTTL